MKPIISAVSVILLSLIYTICSAERGYLDIKKSITRSVGDGITLQIEDNDSIKEVIINEKTVYLVFYAWKNEIVLIGKNNQEKSEGTIWKSELCIPLFGGYCASWSGLVNSLDKGYTFSIILQTSENGELLLIDNKEKADIMYHAIVDEK